MQNMKRKYQVGVIGESMTNETNSEIAREIGQGIARAGARLISGGLGGVMEAASKGAKSEGGETVGIIMGYDRSKANPYIDTVISTGMHHARNIIVVTSSDAIVAIGGSFGTLSEMAYAMKFRIPLIVVNGWEISQPHQINDDPEKLIYRCTSSIEALSMLNNILPPIIHID